MAALEAAAAGANPILDETEEEAKAAVRERALGLLDQRARSRAELRGRLKDKDFDSDVIDAVLDDLAGAGLIDDAAFAREWVRQRASRRGKSRRMLDHELERKGVGAGERAAALDQIDPEDERERALTLARKKARSVREVPADRRERDKALRRIVGVLARRGFPEGMSLALARQALDERLGELD
nr:regulatory protein RecX [Corynebacterium frankenforstense]